ncbi:MAG TPA: hypothetical protein PKZ97_06160 [Azospirillaceae bacterium]|nr:hypothetical protein [Azospirillaceae bacterium]HRQ80683.1 hypothetical protein [Azospirillaceae bacterium]
MKHKPLSAILTAGLLAASSIWSVGAAYGASSDYPLKATGVELCFDDKTHDIALIPNFDLVEMGVVIIDKKDGKAVVKSNTHYKDKTTGGYWTSKLPQNVTLDKGCYTFHFMNKSTPPNTSFYWVCARMNVSNGLKNLNHKASTTVTGLIGARAISLAALIPNVSSSTPVFTNTCPSGL